jgi:hypothetical protein
MNEDPIVAEVRRIREQRARRFDYDIHRIFADLMARKSTKGRSRPTVQDAGEWTAKTFGTARDALKLREEPPRKE